MKFTLAAGLLITATTTHAYTCETGASALTVVKAAGINVAFFTCKNLPGVFATGSLPKDRNDPAQTYLAQVAKQGKCSDESGCTASCTVKLEEDPVAALNTLLSEQEANCEVAGGTYKSNLL